MTTNKKITKLLPSGIELIGLGFLALAVVILAKSRQLLDDYGFSQSNNVLHDSAGHVVSGGLQHLDGFGLTDQVVTFLIWAAVGFVCFGVVSIGMRIYQEAKHDRDLGSDRYIHPANFSRRGFWRQIIVDLVVLALTLLASVTIIYLLLAYILPIALVYSQTFLLNVSLANLGYFIIGLLILYLTLLVIDSCVRAVIYHRQLAA